MNIKYWKIVNELGETNDNLIERIIKTRNAFNIDDENDMAILTENSPMIDMDLAVSRIRKAIYNDEKIAIYGDYDCDGITSTALLYSYLENEGADIIYYIPEREREGYGLNKEAVDVLRQNEVTLIITVDNGISAIEEIDYAQSMGIDVVVTDHHQPREVLPNAVAVVDPHRKDCPSGLTYLCGAGVVFELIAAMEEGDYELVLSQYGDIVAIGTVGDAVELIGKNRVIVKKGLELINSRSRAGISALLNVSGIKEDSLVNSETVAFVIVPRINASGRVGDVEVSIVLLLTEDYEQANELAMQLEDYNLRRKELENEIIREIAGAIKNNREILNDRIIIVKGNNWHHGVTGIVSSRVTEKYGKPCILFSDDGKEARGSGRSIDGFNIIEAISRCSDCLNRFGGHPMAAGLTLDSGKFEEFKTKINDFAKESSFIMPTASITVDCEVSPSELTTETVKRLDILSPYGVGNEYPVFCIRKAALTGIIPLSGGKHIKIKAEKNREYITALCFGMTPEKFEYEPGDLIDIAFTAEINLFGGKESVSLKLKDIRYSGIDQEDFCKGKRLYELFVNGEELINYKNEIAPCREDGAIVYKWLKANGKFAGQPDAMYVKSGINMGYCKFCILLSVMEELGLIKTDEEIDIVKVKEKKDFNSSKILKRLRGV